MTGVTEVALEPCMYCLDSHDRIYGGGSTDIPQVPGAKTEIDWSDDKLACHCGHDAFSHSFHCKFCRECPCSSLHFAGETYADIHDRWY
jgi:hypothetical protein